jgi:DNA-binding transcriptional ArsR family regulator
LTPHEISRIIRFFNSRELNRGTLVDASDSQILTAVSDPVALGALEILLEGPATQKEITALIEDASSAHVSRRMALLESAGIVTRKRPRGHGPYDLTSAGATRALLHATADLGLEIAKARLAAQQHRADHLSEKAFDGYLQDAERDRA